MLIFTLATSMVGFLNPPIFVEEGEVIINDSYDILKMKQEELSKIRGKIVSYVPQATQNSLNPIRKIKDTISDILKGHKMDYKSNLDLILDLIYKTLDEVGLNDRQVLNMYPFQLSGDMKQRTIIAISILLDPEIIIMDEPTTGLDVIVQHEILKLIKKLQKKKDLTIIFISHDISVLFQISDYITVLYGGQILEFGDYSTILEDPHNPYTFLLINSVPVLGVRKKLTKIPGEFSGFNHYPTGCVFSTKCPFAVEVCKKESPNEIHYSNGLYKCFEYPKWKSKVKNIE